MAGSFKFELVSPERLLVSEDVESVVIPGSEGEMTVLSNHAPLMTTIKPGVITVAVSAGQSDRYVVFGGFGDITPEACTVLAEAAVNVNDIDRDDLDQRIQNAQEDVSDAKNDEARRQAEDYLDQLTTLKAAVAA